jgi:hypothetical protein
VVLINSLTLADPSPTPPSHSARLSIPQDSERGAGDDTAIRLQRASPFAGGLGNSSESILAHSGESWKDWVADPNTHPDELSSARLGALS